MREASYEKPQNFNEFIELNKEMSIDDAISKLIIFHKSNHENVLKAFMNLRNFTEGMIRFRESVNSSNPCIVMEGLDSRGQRVRSELIDLYTGQPQMRCS